MENSSEFSSMKLLQLMLETAGERYVDCESIMDILTRAAVTKSVESVVESWISVLEYHANKRRQLGDDRIHDEMHLAINGPEPAHSDPLVQKSMKTNHGDQVLLQVTLLLLNCFLQKYEF